ncbi:hypothetical protein BDQ17DRAFT_1254213 [Cyathus striatus]|nr:hypothetical protein BDQ17DRAFT_1254213 [Cyathus striatus]
MFTGSFIHDITRSRYSMGSFTVTNMSGSSMTFVYYGYDIHIYGAKRSNHGNYSVYIDNGVISYSGNGFDPDNGVFQQPLFSPSTPMSNGLHNVTLTNDEDKYLDVDFVTWQTSVGEDDEQLLTNIFDDMHSAFTYFPPSSWTSNPPNQSRYYLGSGQTVPNDLLNFDPTYSGDAVTLYGPVGPTGSAYTVELDGGSPQFYTMSKLIPQFQLTMYQAFNLGPGTHNLTLRYKTSPSATPGPQFLAIDYASVYTAPSVQNATTNVA